MKEIGMNGTIQIVLLVDENPATRGALERRLESAGYEVQTFADPARVSRCERPANPCCMVTRLQSRGGGGFQLKHSLDHAGVRIPIIFLASDAADGADAAACVEAMKSGAFDVLVGRADAGRLPDVVAAAVAADERELDAERRTDALRRLFETLTLREREVFFGVAHGLANKEVAAELGITEKTVKVHRGRVNEKLAADSVAQLVRMADRLAALGYPLPMFDFRERDVLVALTLP
jgi:FixJ family two-component response regulator